MKMTKEEAFKMLQGKKVYAGEFTKEVQEKLFKIGFKWGSCGKQAFDYKYIIIYEKALQTCTSFESFLYLFKEVEEITISQILGIELKPDFKDGDILYASHNKFSPDRFDYYAIYKSNETLEDINYYVFYNKKSNFFNMDDSCLIEWFRHATDQEKQTLFNELDKQGYKWNAEEKKLEKKRWRAKHGEYYYYFDTILNIEKEKDLLLRVDDERYNIYNYFKSEQEAQQYADKIKELLLNR